jgi:small subunit ribosomal protein S1
MSENEIVNPNADAQESAPVTPMPVPKVPTATTNAPGEDGLAHSSTYDAPPVSTEGTIAPIKEAYQPRVETPHDDFDWSIDKRNVSTYKKEEREKYDSVYDNTFVQINDGEIINGNVVALPKQMW